MSAPSDKRRLIRSEAPLFLGFSCLMGAISLAMWGLLLAADGKWGSPVIAAIFAAGCLRSWAALRSMTAADIGLEE